MKKVKCYKCCGGGTLMKCQYDFTECKIHLGQTEKCLKLGCKGKISRLHICHICAGLGKIDWIDAMFQR